MGKPQLEPASGAKGHTSHASALGIPATGTQEVPRMSDRNSKQSASSSMQPKAPPLEARWQNRFRTLGFQPSKRDRVVTLGTQAYRRPGLRGIGAQPPLGATMGHGLLAYKTPECDFLSLSNVSASSLHHYSSMPNLPDARQHLRGHDHVQANCELLSRLLHDA